MRISTRWTRHLRRRRGLGLLAILVLAAPVIAFAASGSDWTSGGGNIADTHSNDSNKPNAQSASLFESSSQTLVSSACPSTTSDPTGRCIQELATMMKKAESHVPSASSQMVAR